MMQLRQDLRKEFTDYNKKKLLQDILAGITVAAVALPLALAFGVSSGADAAAGLITAILAGLIIGFLSGASYQISGPTGAMAAILIGVVARQGLHGVFLATLIAGIILIIAGVFKAGRIVSIIPLPVITGFTSGIAVIIAFGQIDNFFGTASVGESTLQKLFSYGQIGFAPHIPTMLIGLAVVAIMLLWRPKWQAVIPSSLAAIIIVTGANELLLHWDIATVGAIPRTLLPAARLLPGQIVWAELPALFVPACSIAALGMIESLLCGASAGRMKHETMHADRELVAQGIGNVILPFFGGVPATAAIARTSVGIKAGQQTRLTSIFHSLGLLIFMFLLAPLMSRIPMPALAGILMVTAWRMNEWVTIRYFFKNKLKSTCVTFFLTLLSTVIFDLSIAIIVGISFSAIMFAVKAAGHAEVTVSKVDPARLAKHGLPYCALYDRVLVTYITGSLFFGNCGRVMAALEETEGRADTLILSLRGLAAIDTTGVQQLTEFCSGMIAQGTQIFFVGVQKQVFIFLQRGGLVEKVGQEYFLWSTEQVFEMISAQEQAAGSC